MTVVSTGFFFCFFFFLSSTDLSFQLKTKLVLAESGDGATAGPALTSGKGEDDGGDGAEHKALVSLEDVKQMRSAMQQLSDVLAETEKERDELQTSLNEVSGLVDEDDDLVPSTFYVFPLRRRSERRQARRSRRARLCCASRCSACRTLCATCKRRTPSCWRTRRRQN